MLTGGRVNLCWGPNTPHVAGFTAHGELLQMSSTQHKGDRSWRNSLSGKGDAQQNGMAKLPKCCGTMAGILTGAVNSQLITDAHRAEWAVDGAAFVLPKADDEAPNPHASCYVGVSEWTRN